MKRLKRCCFILLISMIICGVCLVKVYNENTVSPAPNYQIYLYDDGSTVIYVDNIAYVNQLDDGTLIIEGGGEPQEYEYPRRDILRREQWKID